MIYACGYKHWGPKNNETFIDFVDPKSLYIKIEGILDWPWTDKIFAHTMAIASLAAAAHSN